MLTFQDFISFKENSDNVLGTSSTNPSSDKTAAAAVQAFEMILSHNSSSAINFLNHMSEIMPEIKTILQQHGLDGFKNGDFKSSIKNGKKRIVKGLADVTPDDVKDGHDVIAGNSSDSFHNPIG